MRLSAPDRTPCGKRQDFVVIGFNHVVVSAHWALLHVLTATRTRAGASRRSGSIAAAHLLEYLMIGQIVDPF